MQGGGVRANREYVRRRQRSSAKKDTLAKLRFNLVKTLSPGGDRMDNEKTTAAVDNEQAPVESTDKKTQNTVPTLYPDIEYVNRTLP
jgi:hypothetical protein